MKVSCQMIRTLIPGVDLGADKATRITERIKFKQLHHEVQEEESKSVK